MGVATNGRGGNGSGISAGSIRGVNVLPQGLTRGRTITQGRPAIPPRNSNVAPPPIDPEAGIDVPPPSYEQAATEPAYEPTNDTPAYPNTDPSQGTSAYTATSNGQQSSPANFPGRRNTTSSGGPGMVQPLIDQVPGRRIPNQNQGLPPSQQQERQKDCIVM
ncbi:hypothetical protein DID88_004609 [Monilinia fructigena]|uniref:Uncharacterized protein n=1 Tax=Monilinia fructigena TaxID=38457 RepID=A0A395IR37_9HELO|nr:hypothetical protein DID88_004609 [Monilinia fructigena]